MSEEFKVEREEAGGRGRYVVYLPDGSEAEMTYGLRDVGTIVADHTFVPPAFRHTGIALQLVETAIADAREGGFRILPVCSYVGAQFRRHPEWADVRAS